MTGRPLSTNERSIVDALVNALPVEQRIAIDTDLKRSRVIDLLGDGSLLQFIIEGYARPVGAGQHPFPAEATMRDRDGQDLHVILFADKNNRLFELEIIRWAGGPLVEPLLSSMQIF